MKDVSVVVTSYNRPDLLDLTLKSFNNFVNYDFAYKIVIDDFSATEFSHDIRNICKSQGFTYIGVPHKFGQLKCIDAAYSMITTPYIYHCEDDWLFDKNVDLIEKSKAILELDENIIGVYARKDFPNGSINPAVSYCGDIKYHQHNLWWNGEWGGYTFNPGLIRKSDYDKHIKSFYNNFRHEGEVSKYYLTLGKYVVNLDIENQCYYHIGQGRSNDPHLSNKKEII